MTTLTPRCVGCNRRIWPWHSRGWFVHPTLGFLYWHAECR